MNADSLWAMIRAAFTRPDPAFWPIYAGTIASIVVLALLLAWLFGRRRADNLERTLSEISFERLQQVVLPKVDDGEIHIDHILLTEQGILVVDARDIRGVVFGSDRMHDWTVMDNGRRYTIANPQAALFDRVAAVKQVVTDIPVEGRIVFGRDADFSKGVPSLVCTESELLQSLPRVRGKSGSPTRNAFYAEWQTLREATFG